MTEDSNHKKILIKMLVNHQNNLKKKQLGPLQIQIINYLLFSPQLP